MTTRLRLQDHVFTSTRAGQVTLLSLQSDTVLRLRGPVVAVWGELITKGGDLQLAATQLGLDSDGLAPLFSALAAHGFVVHDRPQEAPTFDPISWEGVGTLEAELVTEQYGEAYAGFHNLMDTEKPPERN